MKYYIAILVFTLASFASAIPLPQGLTEAEFRSLRDEETPSRKVDIFSGYAQVRRQGRMHGGEIFEFKRPLTVRNPLEFAQSARSLESVRQEELNRIDAAPVFDLNEMLRKEAAKLKAKVQAASLAAAKAAEEAEQKLEEMVEKVMDETDATRQEVEEIIEEAVESGIEDAEKIIEEDIRTEEESDNVEQEIFEEDDSELGEENENLIADNNEPSSDIDLGSVQEV